MNLVMIRILEQIQDIQFSNDKDTRFLILEKDLVFYKINEVKKEIMVYAVVDQR